MNIVRTVAEDLGFFELALIEIVRWNAVESADANATNERRQWFRFDQTVNSHPFQWLL